MTSSVSYPTIGAGSQQRGIQDCVNWLRAEGLPIKGPPEEGTEYGPS